MFRRVAYWAAIPVLGIFLGGCALSFLDTFQPRAAWRDAEEKACVADRRMLASVAYDRMPRVNGKGACGVYAPLKVAAFSGGWAVVSPSPTIGCPLAAALDGWMTEAVEPAAMAWFGQPVVEIVQLDAYNCRTVNNAPRENLSEHAFGNAIDVAGFRFADGSEITVLRDYLKGEPGAKGFLHEVFAAACARFKTALGPGYPQHGDHFHLDLAHHNADGTSRYCNPTPDVPVVSRPPFTGYAVAATPLFGLGVDRRTTASVALSPVPLPR